MGLGWPWNSIWKEHSHSRTLLWYLASLGAQTVKNPPSMRETWGQSLGWEDPLEEGMTTHSSILAWRIPMDCSLPGSSVHGATKSDLSTQLSTKQLSTQHSTLVVAVLVLCAPIGHALWKWWNTDVFIAKVSSSQTWVSSSFSIVSCLSYPSPNLFYFSPCSASQMPLSKLPYEKWTTIFWTILFVCWFFSGHFMASQ